MDHKRTWRKKGRGRPVGICPPIRADIVAQFKQMRQRRELSTSFSPAMAIISKPWTGDVRGILSKKFLVPSAPCHGSSSLSLQQVSFPLVQNPKRSTVATGSWFCVSQCHLSPAPTPPEKPGDATGARWKAKSQKLRPNFEIQGKVIFPLPPLNINSRTYICFGLYSNESTWLLHWDVTND